MGTGIHTQLHTHIYIYIYIADVFTNVHIHKHVSKAHRRLWQAELLLGLDPIEDLAVP